MPSAEVNRRSSGYDVVTDRLAEFTVPVHAANLTDAFTIAALIAALPAESSPR